jgi:hypothetical protein
MIMTDEEILRWSAINKNARWRMEHPDAPLSSMPNPMQLNDEDILTESQAKAVKAEVEALPTPRPGE